MANFQRKNSTSNAHIGKEFEIAAANIFSSKGYKLHSNYALSIGIEDNKKDHSFDLGSLTPKIIVECKSHKWTSGNNVPSAKMTVWNETMYYFAISSSEYRKILFVLRDERSSNKMTLAEYYLRTYAHLIPSDVEIWEYDEGKKDVVILKDRVQNKKLNKVFN